MIYGRSYWDRVLNMQALVDTGTISPADLELFRLADTPDEAFGFLRDGLTKYHLDQPAKGRGPEIAKTLP